MVMSEKSSFIIEKSQHKLLKERKLKIKKLKHERLIKKLEKEKQPSLVSDGHDTEGHTSTLSYGPTTISIAIPGSIFDNAQSQQLKTYLAGQVARAAAIYKVNEIVIFNESPPLDQNGPSAHTEQRLYGKGCLEMAHLLQYMECPQYLRKILFPHHPYLQFASSTPWIVLHHLRVDEWCDYREAVVVDKPIPKANPSNSYVNAGLYRDVKVDRAIKPGTRLTIKFVPQPDDQDSTTAQHDGDGREKIPFAKKKLKARVVAPDEPFKASGLYWGYNVRVAKNLSSVFSECPYDQTGSHEAGETSGYDFKVGTSDKGENVYRTFLATENLSNDKTGPHLSEHRHCLIVFGGLRGLEYSFETDDYLFDRYNQVSDLFDAYLNVCPSQGSRTIRTEEAILIALSLITPALRADIKIAPGTGIVS